MDPLATLKFHSSWSPSPKICFPWPWANVFISAFIYNLPSPNSGYILPPKRPKPFHEL